MEQRNLPMVALRGMTIVPGMVIHFDVSRDMSMKAINEAMAESRMVFVSGQKDMLVESPKQSDVFEMGTIVEIKQIVKLPKGFLRVMATGKKRARLIQMDPMLTYLRADVEVIEESVYIEEGRLEKEAMIRGIRDVFFAYAARNPKISKELAAQFAEEEDVMKLVDGLIANTPFSHKDLQDLLEETDPFARYELLIRKFSDEIQVLTIKEEIESKVKARIDKNQREYILREQMKLIREELGEDNTQTDAEEFQNQVNRLKAPKEVKDKISKEINRFKSATNSPAEVGVSRTYIETMLEMPWDKTVRETHDMERAKKILEADHYGLEEVKTRILEFLAVRALTKKGESPILCLVGPPGTGKTSIAKSLASALKKPYVRISLGGVRDEAEIRGHRKTYVGAMPGRIANGLKQAGVKNPVMLLDEIDKVSTDYKGDTFSALLEVLDSEQNVKFRDHYLEVPMDLSQVLFITTANTLQTIPAPLLDRMEVLEISSYTENEKLHIAQEHLLAKQIEKHGLKPSWIQFQKGALEEVAEYYTREAGVRQLERKIGEICRKAAREILEDNKKPIKITKKNLEHYLGKHKYSFEMVNSKDQIGIARGLAWTSVGGDTLQIEVNIMAGKGEVILTGQLGDVMKESAMTGISYIRSISARYDISDDFFEKHDIHIHIPEGAVPKDGPSAGITMATAMISAITEKKVKAQVAMTGEVTLRGRVLPIGGLKEKLLAAKRAGIKAVLVPERNKQDVEELQEEITRGLKICFVSEMDEVLRYAFTE